jgi:ribosomal protein S18 acetylase RimI-like enzyme
VTDHPIRDAAPSDAPALAALIRDCGLFSAQEAEGFAATLPDTLAPGSERRWLLIAEGEAAGLLGPEPGPGVWNLLFLAVRPEARRRGLARALLAHVESRLAADGARLLLIDTSTLAPMAPARDLYAREGYEPVATIPDYWGPGDGKLTFLKTVGPA